MCGDFGRDGRAFYGIKTDPQQLNAFLTRTGRFTKDGLIRWRRVPSIAPAHLELAYNGGPSYELIDSNLLAGNPVIALIPLPDGGYHFMVIVGKEGDDYLIRDPAGLKERGWSFRLLHRSAGPTTCAT